MHSILHPSRWGLLALFIAFAGCDTTGPSSDAHSVLDATVASAECALGMTDADALAELDQLEAEVNALEAAGSLNAGQANALRNKIDQARTKIERGQYCPALAHLDAFREQVNNFVDGGVLSEDEAEPLIDGADDIANGEDDLDGVRIVFGSGRDGNEELYIMDADGSNVERLTFDPGQDGQAAVSPDGSQIVFVSDRDGDQEIFVINTDGSNLTQLTFNDTSDGTPTFSPDGTQIAFNSGRAAVGTATDIFVMDADGSNVTQLTFDPTREFSPSFSPDGSTIAFVKDETGTGVGFNIYSMNADGSNMTQLTFRADGVNPEWSPDGSQIVFTDRSRTGGGDIYLMDPDGSNVTLVAEGFAGGFSPNGSYIGFMSRRDGDLEIYLVRPDGSGVTQLTDNTVFDGSPSFVPAAP